MPHQGEKCKLSCWKGDPKDIKMAEKARCKLPKGHPGERHLDENGNWFVVTPDGDTKVAVIR